MKKLLALVVLLSLFFQSKAQDNTNRGLCFSDGFGYVYTFPSVQKSGNSFSATGTSTAYTSSTVTLSGTFTSSSSGTMTMNVVNNNPDGCTNYTDSYTYVGSFTYTRTSGSGSGTWNSYCSGGVIGSGTWAASAPCAGPAGARQSNGPASASGKIISGIRIQPNPAVSSAQIFYSLKSAQTVSITVFNNMQQPVATLVNETKSAGNYSVKWNLLSSNGTKVSAGIYTVVIKTGNSVFTKQLQVF